VYARGARAAASGIAQAGSRRVVPWKSHSSGRGATVQNVCRAPYRLPKSEIIRRFVPNPRARLPRPVPARRGARVDDVSSRPLYFLSTAERLKVWPYPVAEKTSGGTFTKNWHT